MCEMLMTQDSMADVRAARPSGWPRRATWCINNKYSMEGGPMARGLVAATLGLVVLVSACGGPPRLPTARVPPSLLTAPYRVNPGDVLEVRFQYHPADDRRVVVGTDGSLGLPVTGEMDVGGLTLREVEELIETKAARFLREPVVTVTIAESQARAYIGGEVKDPGFVSLVRPMTAVQAVVERGGFLDTADLSEIVVLSHSAGRPVARRLDLKKELRAGKLDATVLRANEIVIVPKTGIAKVNRLVDQWINGMTPDVLRSVRFGTIDVF